MTINCKGELLDLTTPIVMGILNITPDSFYDGGVHKDEDSIIAQVTKMHAEGAAIIDIGAYSSRPGADPVSQEEELARIIPVISLVKAHFPDCIISVDTFRSAVAEASILAGAAIVNDISAGAMDKNMMSIVAKLQVPYIMMHMRGTPQTMKTLTAYENIISDINYYFSEKIEEAKRLGIIDLILDPGFGFAKTTEQNFELLQQFHLFTHFDIPVLAGISRKSMVYKTLNTDAAHALNGTTALHMVALQQGARILRVHDVQAAKECIILFEQLQSARKN